MSIFSDSLKHYIEKNNIRVLPLARYCDIERSTVYKFITGKRLPHSLELVEKMAQFMRLSPLETEKLKNAWKIVSIGPDIYYSRKSVEDFICHFPCKPFSPLPVPSISVSDNVRQDCTVLSSQQYIDNYVHQIILAEANKKHGKIGLFLQPDYPFLFRLLSSLNPSGDLIIDHIICLQPKPFFNEQHQAYNIQYLTELFPVYINGLNYNTWYYYNDIQALFHNPGTLPCMILTSDAAIMCTADYQTGFYYTNPECVTTLWTLFKNNQDKCSILFKPVSMSPENHLMLFDSIDDSTIEAEKHITGIQPEACLTPFITKDILLDRFNHDLPQSDYMITSLAAIFAKNKTRISHDNFRIYFTERGALHFAETGLIEEFPDEFYHPFTISQRIYLLKKIQMCCEKDFYRILREPLRQLPENLHLCVRENDCELTYNTNNGKTFFLIICENQLFEIFNDYLSNMDESNYYTPQEAIAILQRIIDKLI